MLLPARDRELVERRVKQLYAAVAGRDGQLVLVQLAEGDVKQRVLRVKVLLRDDARGRETEDVQAAVAHEAEVGGGSAGEA